PFSRSAEAPSGASAETRMDRRRAVPASSGPQSLQVRDHGSEACGRARVGDLLHALLEVLERRVELPGIRALIVDLPRELLGVLGIRQVEGDAEQGGAYPFVAGRSRDGALAGCAHHLQGGLRTGLVTRVATGP